MKYAEVSTRRTWRALLYMVMKCQWCPGYASCTAIVGMLWKPFVRSRFTTASGGVPSGGKGTLNRPITEGRKAGGPKYDATASTGRWNVGDGTTWQCSPSGNVTSW